MSTDRLITLAIHTYEKAVALKAILESEGVSAVLNNVNLSKPSLSSGVRVRINERDLPLALRIVENPDIFNKKTSSESEESTIIVPVDFSDYSHRACLMAFNLAKLHNSKIEIVHSYIHSHPIDKFKFKDSELTHTEINDYIELSALEEMRKFNDKLIEQIKFGIIPAVKFSTKVVEGVPEDIITLHAKQKSPLLIVMGTRGAGKKEKELIGSVTGEVLDSCRFPVFAVPESANIFNIDSIKHIVFFCNNHQEDIIALDTMYRLLPNLSINVTIVNVPHKTINVIDDFATSDSDLLKYCINNYPRFNFKLERLQLSNIANDFDRIGQNRQIDLIVVPNKKKNVFARFFNPSLAHKILLHADIPMMTIPI